MVPGRDYILDIHGIWSFSKDADFWGCNLTTNLNIRREFVCSTHSCMLACKYNNSSWHASWQHIGYTLLTHNTEDFFFVVKQIGILIGQ